MLEVENEGNKGFFGQFSRTFWIVNSLELFERGAYYGTMSIMSVHAVYNLGISYSTVGVIYAMLIILLYFIPLISASLAEKYGYRNVLLTSFLILVIGYFLLFMVQPGQLTFFIFSLIIVGIGAGAFKPIISASIAHVTLEQQRNLAYSIYYWMINLGAFLLPLSVGLFLGTESLFHFVFLVSTVLIGINIAISFFLFKDPVKSQKLLSVGKAIKRIVPALKDKKFVVLLLIYSGFWFMFAINHAFLPVYMVDFKRMPSWFLVPFLATINPGTIILVGPFLGKLVEKYKSLNMVMLGIVIFSIGLMIVGLSNSPYIFAIGIIIFSMGEFITHPGFIAYVSKIAPKKMVAIYMACIFIATGLGNAVGGFIQGFWYQYFAVDNSMPKIFFALIAVVGMLTLVCFILYNRWIIRDLLIKEPNTEADTGIWTKPITVAVVLLFIPITIYGAYLGGTNVFYDRGEEEEVAVPKWAVDYDQVTVELSPIQGYSDENSDMEEKITLSPNDVQNLISLEFSLSWVDEEPVNDYIYDNLPDTFSFTVQPPGNDTVLGPFQGSTGFAYGFYDPVSGSTPDQDPYLNGTGDYIVTIQCGECGNQVPRVNLLGFREEEDTGNDWTLDVKYKHYVKNEA